MCCADCQSFTTKTITKSRKDRQKVVFTECHQELATWRGCPMDRGIELHDGYLSCPTSALSTSIRQYSAKTTFHLSFYNLLVALSIIFLYNSYNMPLDTCFEVICFISWGISVRMWRPFVVRCLQVQSALKTNANYSRDTALCWGWLKVSFLWN